MRTILLIIKKELTRFFKDYRLMLTAVLLPGVLIFVLYSLMGTIMDSMTKEDEDYQPTAIVLNMPAVPAISGALDALFDVKDATTEEDAVNKVKNGEAQLFIAFPQNMQAGIPDNPYKVSVYYNSSDAHSSIAYQQTIAVLSGYQNSIAHVFDINADANIKFDLADKDSLGKTIMATVVPMVLLMLLFSGCMAVAPESIAGEKERGTIATLLVTPVKRSHIAIGKIIALSCVALLSGLSSTLGLILSLPKLMGGDVDISFSMYGFGEYMAILGVVLSTVLILVALIAIISAYAKSVKEASGLVVPVMLVVLLCGVFSMFAKGVAGIGLFFIPIFNSALLISSVLAGTMTGGAIAATICTNLVFAGVLVFVLTLMFKSERVMFNR